jgi:hypothetical protein
MIKMRWQLFIAPFCNSTETVQRPKEVENPANRIVQAPVSLAVTAAGDRYRPAAVQILMLQWICIMGG